MIYNFRRKLLPKQGQMFVYKSNFGHNLWAANSIGKLRENYIWPKKVVKFPHLLHPASPPPGMIYKFGENHQECGQFFAVTFAAKKWQQLVTQLSWQNCSSKNGRPLWLCPALPTMMIYNFGEISAKKNWQNFVVKMEEKIIAITRAATWDNLRFFERKNHY